MSQGAGLSGERAPTHAGGRVDLHGAPSGIYIGAGVDRRPNPIAIHEAGHAIVAFRLGLAPTRIHVQGSGGVTRHVPTKDLAAVPAIAAAGMAAEELFGVRAPRSLNDRRMAHTAARMLAGTGRPTAADFLTAGIYAAQAIVRHNREAIASLAARLGIAAELSGPELTAAVEAACSR